MLSREIKKYQRKTKNSNRKDVLNGLVDKEQYDKQYKRKGEERCKESAVDLNTQRVMFTTREQSAAHQL